MAGSRRTNHYYTKQTEKVSESNKAVKFMFGHKKFYNQTQIGNTGIVK